MHEKAKSVSFIYMQPQKVIFKYVKKNMKQVSYCTQYTIRSKTVPKHTQADLSLCRQMIMLMFILIVFGADVGTAQSLCECMPRKVRVFM